jgi:hypothetical protein
VLKLGAVLERVAVYQTRLRVPGVALDARGVALGHRGLVLLSSLDRLAMFLALYTEARSLESILGSLRIEVVRSTLGASEAPAECFGNAVLCDDGCTLEWDLVCPA